MPPKSERRFAIDGWQHVDFQVRAVEDGVEGGSSVRFGEADRLEALEEDRHSAAVDGDRDRVREDPDEGEAHAWLAPVRP